VLRIYHDHIPWEYVEARRIFYAELAQHALPFAVPEIHSVGAWVGHIYTVERRMPGRDFGEALLTLEGAARTQALTSYLEAVTALGNVRFLDKPWGELITTPPLHGESWQEYLVARMARTLAQSRADLEADLPGLDGMLAQIRAFLPRLGDEIPKSLVHGDYFPANVFVDDTLRISGVGDFSYATVVGDARQDLAGAIWLLGAMPAARREDSVFLRQLVVERWGEAMGAVVDFYRLYYSIYFSGCKRDDPATYGWCVANLRAAHEAIQR
jgi:aminoglycoside phosphotransferase (APT) family kinase protein